MAPPPPEPEPDYRPLIAVVALLGGVLLLGAILKEQGTVRAWQQVDFPGAHIPEVDPAGGEDVVEPDPFSQ